MNQPQEKPRLALCARAPRSGCTCWSSASMPPSQARCGSTFDAVHTVSLDITPDAETATRMLSTKPVRPRGGGSGDLGRRFRVTQIRQGQLPLDRHAGRHPQPGAAVPAPGGQVPDRRPAVQAGDIRRIRRASLLLAEEVNVRRRRQQNACWRSAPIPTTSRSAAAARWPSTMPATTCSIY